jgi:hypothetical protein
MIWQVSVMRSVSSRRPACALKMPRRRAQPSGGVVDQRGHLRAVEISA